MTYQGYAIRRVTLPAGEKTAIVVDVDCNYFSLKSASGNALVIASDPNDPEQSDGIAANAQEILLAAWRPYVGEVFRFPAGSTLVYAWPAGNSDEVAILKLCR